MINERQLEIFLRNRPPLDQYITILCEDEGFVTVEDISTAIEQDPSWLATVVPKKGHQMVLTRAMKGEVQESFTTSPSFAINAEIAQPPQELQQRYLDRLHACEDEVARRLFAAWMQHCDVVMHNWLASVDSSVVRYLKTFTRYLIASPKLLCSCTDDDLNYLQVKEAHHAVLKWALKQIRKQEKQAVGKGLVSCWIGTTCMCIDDRFTLALPDGQVGQGAEVLTGQNHHQQHLVTAKVSWKAEADQSKALKTELKILNGLHSSGYSAHAVTVHANYFNFDGCGSNLLVMEYSAETLNEKLNGQVYAVPEVLSLIKDLIDCVACLHCLDAVWTTCCPQNFVLSPATGKYKMMNLHTVAKVGRRLPLVGATTTPYTPPEVVLAATTSQLITADLKQDVWSLAIIIYTLLVGKTPWLDLDHPDDLQRILTLQPLELDMSTLPNNTPLERKLSDLLMRMLNVDPSARPSLTDIQRDRIWEIDTLGRLQNCTNPLPSLLPVDVLCPRIFWLIPEITQFDVTVKPKRWFKQNMLLVPICEYSFQPIGFTEDRLGIQLTEPRDFVNQHSAILFFSYYLLKLAITETKTLSLPVPAMPDPPSVHDLIDAMLELLGSVLEAGVVKSIQHTCTGSRDADLLTLARNSIMDSYMLFFESLMQLTGAKRMEWLLEGSAVPHSKLKFSKWIRNDQSTLFLTWDDPTTIVTKNMAETYKVLTDCGVNPVKRRKSKVVPTTPTTSNSPPPLSPTAAVLDTNIEFHSRNKSTIAMYTNTSSSSGSCSPEVKNSSSSSSSSTTSTKNHQIASTNSNDKMHQQNDSGTSSIGGVHLEVPPNSGRGGTMVSPLKPCAIPPEDKHVTECQGCGKEFGLFTRKHHCRACVGCYCDKCSPAGVILPHDGFSRDDFQRCCTKCLRMLKEEYTRKKTLANKPVNVPWPFIDVPKCYICQKNLKTDKERVLCSSCKYCLCTKCCQPRVMLPHKNKNWYYTCDYCTHKLMDEFITKGTVRGFEVPKDRNKVFNPKTCVNIPMSPHY